MTEKRFYIAESNLIDGYCVFDREKKYAFYPKLRKADCLNDAHTLNELHEEKEQLKIFLEALKEELSLANRDNDALEKENEQLKQRNDRQAKQLDRLYCLIEEKDWRTLNDILDDFKRCEEQLRKEWGTYGDVE